jgi:peptide/nickel transport system permease protein
MKPWALVFLGVLCFMALFRDLIATEKPLYCQINGKNYYPAFRALANSGDRIYIGVNTIDSLEINHLWYTLPPEDVIFTLIPFSSGEKYQALNAIQKPLSFGPEQHPKFRHWLGTNSFGWDIASCIVSGARVALQTAFVTISLAFIFGLFFGLFSGYYGDDQLRVTRGGLFFGILSLPFAWFYAFTARAYQLMYPGGWLELIKSISYFILTVLVFILLGQFLSKLLPYFRKKITIPADQLIMRLGEFFNAVPKILVIIAFAAWRGKENQSTLPLLAMMGFMSWPNVSKYLRAELLIIRELDYIAMAKAQGFSDLRIMFKHMLPNAWRPLAIALTMSVASAILLEAALSYLGYGSKSREVSWGVLLTQITDYQQHWWVAAAPIVMITLTVYSLYSFTTSDLKE